MRTGISSPTWFSSTIVSCGTAWYGFINMAALLIIWGARPAVAREGATWRHERVPRGGMRECHVEA